jgi:uncharacterized protein (DUF1330 family)
MPAYMIAQYKSLKEYDAYRAVVGDLNRKAGARILTKPGTARAVEGDWPFDNAVIIEFQSMDHANEFSNSPEYAAVKELRKDAPPITILLVDG